MADAPAMIDLSRSDLREVTGYAVVCARSALVLFERPLPKASQVKHILGSAAHAARAFELAAGGDRSVGAEHLARLEALAPAVVVDVLRRYPPAPDGGARVGELMRLLDASLR